MTGRDKPLDRINVERRGPDFLSRVREVCGYIPIRMTVPVRHPQISDIIPYQSQLRQLPDDAARC